MEEDNRFYDASHPFRQYQYRRFCNTKPFPNDETPKNESGILVRGMIPVDGESANCSESSVHNDGIVDEISHDGNHDSNRNYNIQYQQTISGIQNSSWLEESQKLLRDYHRRFHRQSLTEQAKDLLDRAFAISGIKDEMKNKNQKAMNLCTEALVLCKTAIDDQQETSNRNDHIGGSYLVSGDIRLRRKGEGLASKIFCLRASLRYQEGHYEESLEDCEAAISIWNQKYSIGRRRRKVFDINRSKPYTSRNNVNTSQAEPRARKNSHKHLYLLKARNLTAMGRYREAAMWLTHPNKLPAKTFQRSSMLMETDAAMNHFLEKILLRGVRYATSGCNEQNGIQTEDFYRPECCAVKSRFDIPRMPSSKKLWSNLLHSIDKRLNEGMVGAFQTTKDDNSTEKSNSANTIYELLRQGPVLFHN